MGTFLFKLLIKENAIFNTDWELGQRPVWDAGEPLIAIMYRFLCSGAVKRRNCLSDSEFSAFSAAEFRTCQNCSIRELHPTPAGAGDHSGKGYAHF